MSTWDRFESLFEKHVDLLTDSSIINPFLKKSTNSSKILICYRQGRDLSKFILKYSQ